MIPCVRAGEQTRKARQRLKKISKGLLNLRWVVNNSLVNYSKRLQVLLELLGRRGGEESHLSLRNSLILAEGFG